MDPPSFADQENQSGIEYLFTFLSIKVVSLDSETPHKRYRRRARRLYRILILLSVLALILAIIALYLGDEI